MNIKGTNMIIYTPEQLCKKLLPDQGYMYYFKGDDIFRIKDTSGMKNQWADGQLHREDGPAVEWADGSKSWWVDGKYLREENIGISSRLN